MMRIFIYIDITGFTTWIACSAVLEAPWCWPWFLPVIIWSAGVLSWRVTFATTVHADVLFIRLCRCVTHICVMWPRPTPGTESLGQQSFLRWSPPQAEQWTRGLHSPFGGGVLTSACPNNISLLSTLWAFYLTSLWWFLCWFLGHCRWIYYCHLTSVVGQIWCVQT